MASINAFLKGLMSDDSMFLKAHDNNENKKTDDDQSKSMSEEVKSVVINTEFRM
jgi:hypothetical protein